MEPYVMLRLTKERVRALSKNKRRRNGVILFVLLLWGGSFFSFANTVGAEILRPNGAGSDTGIISQVAASAEQAGSLGQGEINTGLQSAVKNTSQASTPEKTTLNYFIYFFAALLAISVVMRFCLKNQKLRRSLDSFLSAADRIHQIEAKPALWVAAFLSITFIRDFMENFIEWPSQVIGWSFRFEFSLFWILGFFCLAIFMHLISGEKLSRISKIMVYGWTVTFIAPIFDAIYYYGQNFTMGYVNDNILENFLTFYSQSPHGFEATMGIRVEIVLVIITTLLYVAAKTKSWPRAVLAGLGMHAIIFTIGALPAFYSSIAGLFNLKTTLSYPNGYSIICLVVLAAIIPLYLKLLKFNLFYNIFKVKPNFSGFRISVPIIKALAKNIRPTRVAHYLTLTLLGILLGGYYKAGDIMNIDILGASLLLGSILFAWLFAVGLNDIFDQKIDRISNLDRPLINGSISLRDYKIFTAIFAVLAIVFASFVSFWSASIIFYYLVACSFIYSAPPLRLRQYLVLPNVLIGLCSLLALLLGLSLMGGVKTFELLPKSLALLIFIAFTLASTIKDLKDYEGDKAENIRTLPIVLGLKNARLVVGLLIAALFVAAPFFINFKMIWFYSGVFAVAALFAVIKKQEKYVFGLWFVFAAIIAGNLLSAPVNSNNIAAANSNKMKAVYEADLGQSQPVAVVNSVRPDYAYEARGDFFGAYFKEISGSADTVRFEVGSSSIAYSFKDLGDNELRQAFGVASGNTYTYPAYRGVQIKYSVTADTMLEEFIFESELKINPLAKKIVLENADFKIQADGSIAFFSQDSGKKLWTIPKPYMYELNNKARHSFGLHYEILKNPDGSYLLKKVIDPAGQKWLASVAYPLVIDDTTIYNPSSGVNKVFGMDLANCNAASPPPLSMFDGIDTDIDSAWDLAYSHINVDDSTDGHVQAATADCARVITDDIAAIRTNYVITQNKTNISQLNFTYKGYAKKSDASYYYLIDFYVWNFSTSLWVGLGDSINLASEDTHSSATTTDIQNYIDGSGNLHFLAYCYTTGGNMTANKQLRAQYEQLQVTYTVPPTLTTSAPTSVATSTMTLNANLSATGGADATQHGFAWGTSLTLAGGSDVATTTGGVFSGTGNFTSTSAMNLSGLTPGIEYFFRAYATNSAGTGYGSITSTSTIAVSAPTVTTQAVSSIAATTATGNGNITVTGNINPTVRGMIYGLTTAYGATTTPETGNFSTGAFTSSITSLTCNTLYYVKAYATNSVGTGYGSDKTFTTTACIPTLTTSAPTSVATSTMTLNANLSATGGADATQHGFAWGTNSTLSGGSDVATTTGGAFSGTGNFTSTSARNLSGLTPGIEYFFRAYATNSAGTGFGSITSTTTIAVSAPTVTTQDASSIAATTATGNGNITSTGNINPTARGMIYGLTTAYGATTTSSGSFSTGDFTSPITSLTCNTLYYAKAYATNSVGTGYGSDKTFTTTACIPTLTTSAPTSVATSTMTLNANLSATGGADATQHGFAWGTSLTLAGGSDVATTTGGAFSGTGDFTSTSARNLSGLTASTTYYFRAYATNSAGTGYGSITSTSTIAVSAPTVTTQDATSVAATTATGNGTITVTGNINPTARGMIYGLTTAYGATTTDSGSFSTGAFTSSITSLTCNTLYYAKAYATNSQGTGYGSGVSFTTSACIPTLTTSAPTSVATSTMTLNADLSATGGADATQHGFAWGTSSTLSGGSDVATTTGGVFSGTGNFTSTSARNLSGLTPGIEYFFRAYATNSAGTGYGSITSTSTIAVVVPTVSASVASSILTTAAILNGSIDNIGGDMVTDRGFEWGVSASYGTTITTSDSYGTGSFTSNLTGLTCNTSYHFRSFATNSAGTGTSADATFTTSACGGGLPPGAYSSPALPSGGEFSILIQNGADYINSRTVALKLNGGADAKSMAISNSADFYAVGQEPYQTTKAWTLSDNDGLKTIYVRFYTQTGQPSPVVSDTIMLDTKPPEIKITESQDYYSSAEEVILIGQTEAKAEIILAWDKKYGLIHADEQGNLTMNLGRLSTGEYQLNLTPTDLAGNRGESLMVNLIIRPAAEVPEMAPAATPKKTIIEKVPEIIKSLIPEFLKPKAEAEKPEAMIIIPAATPLAMRGRWNLLPEKSIKTFVLAPLPAAISQLAEKFPELGVTLKKIGITKITDLEKLQTVKLTLPGLTARVGLPTAEIQPGRFALPKNIPVAELSPPAKQQIPTEIVFARTGGQLIDFNMALSVTAEGEPQQKISTISGRPLQLVVKPDQPVKSVKGYVVFKSKKPRLTSFQLPFHQLVASLIFANPVFAKPQEQPVRVEEKLVLLEFEYTDSDGDGIYTAEIQAPIADGEYEIITVMDFMDPELGKKEIHLITVVDPEGYIYEKDGGREIRIPGAIVSILWLNPGTKQYELWPAKEYQQENPQVTDVTGKYSFLVPEGTYYLKTEAPGYLAYESKAVEVREGSGVHINIELKTKYWFLNVFDWKTLLLIVVILLLLYNFYKDRIREKLMRKS